MGIWKQAERVERIAVAMMSGDGDDDGVVVAGLVVFGAGTVGVVVVVDFNEDGDWWSRVERLVGKWEEKYWERNSMRCGDPEQFSWVIKLR